MEEKTDYEQVYDDFWKSIVEDDSGVVDFEQVKKELYDYHMLLEEVPRVYDNLTGGMVSKPNTLAVEVISAADEYTQSWVDQDAIERNNFIIDIFENAGDDELASEIREDIFDALGIKELS